MAFPENVNVLKFLKEVEPVSSLVTPPCVETPPLKVFQNGIFSGIMETLGNRQTYSFLGSEWFRHLFSKVFYGLKFITAQHNMFLRVLIEN